MKQTLQFLKKLKKNNNSEWMREHKEEYLAAKKEFEFLVQELITRIGMWDSKLPYLEPKNCVFRLNRDVRFSDDKRPYKENFGAFFAYGGKKGGLPGYYLNVSPKEIFVAGGVWMPEPPQLLKLRRYISENGDELKSIVSQTKFKKIFTKLSTQQMLKRPPKGFDPENPYVEFLKLKSFTVSKDLTEADALKKNFGLLVDKNFQLIKPLNSFLLKGLE